MKTKTKNTPPLVAIHCMVYNHAPFLRQCFDGFVMQQTEFPFVAIVHDDASTDNSADIINEYTTKYPDIFRPIYETENQYGKPGAIFRIMLEAGKDAKYTAFCEGDDYWTDPAKLQRQINFLETHLDYSATADNGMVKEEVTNIEHIFNTASSHDVNQEEIIITRRFPTAGVLCRTKALIGMQDVCHIFTDTIQWCWLLSKGKFRYEAIVSSVYRKGAQGVTVNTEPYIFAKKAELWNLEILRVFNISKDFMYLHIAKEYKYFVITSIKQHHITSAIKCLVIGGANLVKAVIYKIV